MTETELDLRLGTKNNLWKRFKQKFLTRIICDNCGKVNPLRKIDKDGKRTGYTTCCVWGKPWKQTLRIRNPFYWS